VDFRVRTDANKALDASGMTPQGRVEAIMSPRRCQDIPPFGFIIPSFHAQPSPPKVGMRPPESRDRLALAAAALFVSFVELAYK
jgi:hypothetical protein